jgi:deoxyribodipyrimidine photo-lyase
MPAPHAIFWFRRDLRLADNAGLYHVLQSGMPVIPVFIFDSSILSRLGNKADRRVHFIHHALSNLKAELEALGSSLTVIHGIPKEVIPRLAQDCGAKAVFTNHDYEPYAIQRDTQVQHLLKEQGISFHTFKDQCIFEKDEVMKDDGTPYTVFTPYSRKWKALLTDFHLKAYPTERYFANLIPMQPVPLPTLQDIGFIPTDLVIPPQEVGNELLSKYHDTRNFPSVSGTSRLSVHLRFGTLSIRQLARTAATYNETFLNELIWRDFYMIILWHFPHVVNGAFRPQYDRIVWETNTDHFQAWCEGRTGYPIVDAGMRELNATGFMHNRVRMIVASFLTKHLLLDWRWGEAYFAEKLLDFDLSANNGGWQWASGSGCDAAPYFRVFSPDAQTLKFDPDLRYIRKWVPDFQELTYPRPIVDHRWARERAIARYREALAAA